MKTPGSPDALTTSHLSLQYAYLTPSPTSTLARNVPEHTPALTCVHVASHAPFGLQLVMSAVLVRARKLWQTVDAWSKQIGSIGPRLALAALAALCID